MKENVAPPPNVRRTAMVPPWASTIARQMARPMPGSTCCPRPAERLEDALARRSGAIPRPWSDDLDAHVVAVARGRRPTTSLPRGAWRASVVEQVGHHLLELAVVGVGEREVGGEVGAAR